MTWYNFLKALFGTATADKMTNYQYWKIPPAENVDPPRITDVVKRGERIPWPAYQQLELINFTGKPMKDGVMTGRPMQWGLSTQRTISWGYKEYGYKYFTKLPNPKIGYYWVTGHPVPMYDRHCIVREPSTTGKVFHEMIQLDPYVDPNSIISNNALGWGKFVDGTLVDGTYSTAPDIAAHPYVWTPWSKEKPHRVALTVTDYEGADGDLVGQGVKAGSLVLLDPESESYKAMIALGGECAAIAKAAAIYGAIVIDRGGTPSLAIQPGSQWAATNINKLKIAQGDFIYAQVN
jgi:hypothetical protein